MSSSQPVFSSSGTRTPNIQKATLERPAAGERYTAVAQVLHWITATLMFLTLPLAWVGVNIPEADSKHETLLILHKSVGLTVLAIVALRLAWRASHPPPPLSLALARWERGVSQVSHWMLYLVLVGMPLSGYMLSAASGHPTAYFGLLTLPAFPKNIGLQHAALLIHVIVGQWLVYALIVLHVAATVWHVWVKHDGVLDRMLPPQDQEPIDR